MKKFITVLLLAATLIFGGVYMYASNAGKKPKAKVSATASRSYDYVYTGKIGPYPVKVYLNSYAERYGIMGSEIDVKGKYTYTKEGNSLSLKGTMVMGLSNMVLEEYTKSGRHSGTWMLNSYDGYKTLEGTFTNLINGKEYNVYLRSVR